MEQAGVRSNRARWIGAIAFGIVLAVAAFLQSASVILENQRPGFAAAIWPSNDRAYAHQAMLEIARGQEFAREQMAGNSARGSAEVRFDPSIFAKVKRPAVSSLLASGLSASALGSLAFADAVSGGEKKAEKFARVGAALNRRDLMSQIMLTRAGLVHSDISDALAHFDIALTTHPNANRDLFPLLASALTDDDMRKAFVPYMRSDNPWLANFLIFALAQSPDPAIIGRLVANAPELPERPGLSLREVAVPRMVQIGEPVLARSIAMKMPKGLRPAAGGGLSNARFSFKDQVVQPFGWNFVDDATVVFTQSNGLEATSEYSYRGELIRQLVTLPRGDYQFKFAGHLSPGVVWNVRCTGSGTPLIAAGTKNLIAFSVPSDCPGQWVRLVALGKARISIRLDSVQIRGKAKARP